MTVILIELYTVPLSFRVIKQDIVIFENIQTIL